MTSVMLISGSLRDASINGAVVRTVSGMLNGSAEAHTFIGIRDLPHFDPDVEEVALPDTVAALRRMIDRNDAVLICTPEYAGSLPGAFKNLLDWTIGGIELVGKPTAWINCSSSATKAAGAHATLRTVLTYAGADIVEKACLHIPIARVDISLAGEVENASCRDAIRGSVEALMAYARRSDN
jgi:NAD(P)H-dependent FMN reductase